MINNFAKLMVVSTMSFFLLGSNSFAEEADDSAKKATTSVTRQLQKHAIGIGLGQTFMLGQFDSFGDDKITADLLYTYTASYSFDLLINIHMSDHAQEDKKVFLRGYTLSIKGRSYEFDAFSPFLLGGLGFYSPQIEEADGDRSEEKFTFGINAGGGVDLRLNSNVIIGMMGQFHKPFEVEQDETKDINGSYFKLLLTSMYLF